MIYIVRMSCTDNSMEMYIHREFPCNVYMYIDLQYDDVQIDSMRCTNSWNEMHKRMRNANNSSEMYLTCTESFSKTNIKN